MEDIYVFLRSSTRRSLVFVGELRQGTSPTDGTSLAGAIPEAIVAAEMSSIFATDLHDILTLPLSQEAKTNLINIEWKSILNHQTGIKNPVHLPIER